MPGIAQARSSGPSNGSSSWSCIASSTHSTVSANRESMVPRSAGAGWEGNWKIFHTDYRRPYSTYHDAFDAARGLFFFSITWGSE